MRKGTGTWLLYPDFGSTVVGRNVSSDPRNSGMSDGKSELRSFEIPRINLNVRKNLTSCRLRKFSNYITAKKFQRHNSRRINRKNLS